MQEKQRNAELLALWFIAGVLPWMIVGALWWVWTSWGIGPAADRLADLVAHNTVDKFIEGTAKDSSSLDTQTRVVMMAGIIGLGVSGFALKVFKPLLYGHAEVILGVILGWQTLTSKLAAQHQFLNSVLLLSAALAISKGLENIKKALEYWESPAGKAHLEKRARRRERRMEEHRRREEHFDRYPEDRMIL